MIAAAALALLVQAAAQPDTLSTPDAYRLGLERFCLPLVNGARADDLSAELKLRPLPAALLPNRVASEDRGWYLPASEPMLAIAWKDGSCSVQRLRGDPKDLTGVMEQVLRPRPEGFKPGRVDAPAPDLHRATYCSAQRPYPLVVTITSATPGSKNRLSTSSTVFRSTTPGEPEFCVFNGAR